MTQYVENRSIRINHEESTNAPWFVREWIGDLEASFYADACEISQPSLRQRTPQIHVN